ncbi:hypothetical protein [Leminorella grimontii]
MKPENLYRLTGKDVLQHRRRPFDLITVMAFATAAGLVITILLVAIRTL